MTPRDRRALMMGGLVVAAAVLGLRLVPLGVRRATAAHALLSERAVLLARTRDELAALPKLRDSAAILTQALVALAPQVLSGATAAEAGADLSGRMNLAASRAPARVDRLDPVLDSSGAGRLGRARVHAAFETDVRGLIAFLRAIDAADEMLTLDELHIEAPEPGAPDRGPEILRVEVTISGWYIKARETQNGKRET
ncbi:MAG TPA: type II secretion system protein GspM [Gemmatimonadales bacterium]|nr:type II secretion system protein GspM [Gemmatimonadales bacterium]